MCDEAEPGLCAVGSFLLGSLAGTIGGFATSLADGHLAPAPGLAGGAALGVVAAAFPNGAPLRVCGLAVAAASAPAALCCATLHVRDAGVLFAAASLSSGAATLTLLATDALARHRRLRLEIEAELAKETSV